MDTIIENCKLINKIGNFYVGIKNGKIAKISKIPFEGGKKLTLMENYFSQDLLILMFILEIPD